MTRVRFGVAMAAAAAAGSVLLVSLSSSAPESVVTDGGALERSASPAAPSTAPFDLAWFKGAPEAAFDLSRPIVPPGLLGPQDFSDLNPGYDGRFQFVRIQYTVQSRGGFGFGRGRRGGREPMWAHDYPRAERNFMRIIDETTFVGPLTEATNILKLDDPELFKYPVAYIVEVGSWEPSQEEVRGLSQYLLKGGFLIVDDFRGGWDLQQFSDQMQRVLPDAALVELDGTHEIFDSFFRVDPMAVIPPYGGQLPRFFGIFEDNDPEKRLLAIANYGNDIAEYWEFSDRGYYPIDLSNEAYKLGVNYIVYAMTH